MYAPLPRRDRDFADFSRSPREPFPPRPMSLNY